MPPEKLEIQRGGLTEKVANPAYTQWIAQDQQLLGYLLNSISKEVLPQVASMTSSHEVWKALKEMYSSQSKVRVVNIRMTMANLKKGAMTAAEYFSKMKAYGDEMASAGKTLDDDMVSYLLAGIDIEYNPLVTSVTSALSWNDEVSVSDLYSQMVSFDARMERLQGVTNNFNSSANAATRGGHTDYQRQGGGGRGNRDRPQCQLCEKYDHTVLDCRHRYDNNFVPYSKTVGSATTTYGVDSNWYTDSGATDHITGELNTASTMAMRRCTRQVEQDQTTRRVIHRGRSRGGLYPFIPPCHTSTPTKLAFGVSRPSST